MKNQKRPLIFRDLIEVLAGFAVFGILLAAFLFTVKTCAKEVLDVAGRMAAAERGDASESHEEAVLEAERYMAGSTGVGRVSKALWIYTEGDGPAPEWYDPDEPMAVEWEAIATDINVPRKDIGCPDYNAESTLWGWDGHSMKAWEMAMFARIAYLECRGCSRECQEAVVDAILRLWESEYYSTTLYGTLSAVNEDGTYAYSPYPTMWGEEYDPDILAEMRELCEERFYNAPEYTAPFFRTKHYHADWSVPCYCFTEDNVYFSAFKEGVQ